LGESPGLPNFWINFQKWPRLEDMNKELIDQLRQFSCVRNKEKTWIAGLNDSQLLEVFHRLQSGETSKSIARHVQAWGINPTSSIHALSQGILKFNKRIAHLLAISAGYREREHSKPFTGDFTPEDTLESLDYIANLHRARIKAMLEEEKRTGIKFPYLHRDMMALSTLQKLIMRQKTWEKYNDDPMKQRRIAGLEKEIHQKFDTMMKQIGEDEKIEVAGALGKFLEWADQNAVTLQIGPDGKYIIPEKPEA